MILHRWGDAAFAANLNGTSFSGVGGYAAGSRAFHIWPHADWDRFPGFRLPICVPTVPGHPDAEALMMVSALHDLGVPEGCRTVVDMETATDRAFVEAYGARLVAAGYRVEVYGSASTVFKLPPLNGYWVADYTSDMRVIDGLLANDQVRSVQYADTGPYDLSLRKNWTQGEMWHG